MMSIDAVTLPDERRRSRGYRDLVFDLAIAERLNDSRRVLIPCWSILSFVAGGIAVTEPGPVSSQVAGAASIASAALAVLLFAVGDRWRDAEAALASRLECATSAFSEQPLPHQR